MSEEKVSSTDIDEMLGSFGLEGMPTDWESLLENTVEGNGIRVLDMMRRNFITDEEVTAYMGTLETLGGLLAGLCTRDRKEPPTVSLFQADRTDWESVHRSLPEETVMVRTAGHLWMSADRSMIQRFFPDEAPLYFFAEWADQIEKVIPALKGLLQISESYIYPGEAPLPKDLSMLAVYFQVSTADSHELVRLLIPQRILAGINAKKPLFPEHSIPYSEWQSLELSSRNPHASPQPFSAWAESIAAPVSVGVLIGRTRIRPESLKQAVEGAFLPISKIDLYPAYLIDLQNGLVLGEGELLDSQGKYGFRFFERSSEIRPVSAPDNSNIVLSAVAGTSVLTKEQLLELGEGSVIELDETVHTLSQLYWGEANCLSGEFLYNGDKAWMEIHFPDMAG